MIQKWTKYDISKLKIWYKFIGDTEISKMLNELKGIEIFSKKSVEKKRGYLNLKRTKQQVKLIMSDNALIFNLKIKEGETTIQDNHKFIKIDNKLISYSRWIYEKHNGEIPEGMIIFYKDFDTLNDEPDNLEIRKRGGFYLKDFQTGLNIINYRIEKTQNNNIMNWYNMNQKEQNESMIYLNRLFKIKQRIENNIHNMINRGKLKPKETGFYSPVPAF
jgi:hypothetical protein